MQSTNIKKTKARFACLARRQPRNRSGLL